jgi:hypothetical protein
MGKHRRQFSAALKAKISVEALKGTAHRSGNRIKLRRPSESSHELEKAAVGFFSGSNFPRDECDRMKPTSI